jgi:hypothetical protein
LNLGAAISWTKAVAGLASVVKAEGARVVAVGERRKVISELGIVLFAKEASDVEGSSPSTRIRDGREILRGEVGEDQRAVIGHIAVRSYSIAEI